MELNSVPPMLHGGQRFGKNVNVTIPATGGTVNFEDEAGEQYQIQLPRQSSAREITFKSVQPQSLKDVPHDKVIRILAHLEAQDANGPVHTFRPHMTVIAKYNSGDLKHPVIGGKHDKLRLWIYHAGTWTEQAMAPNPLNTQNSTLSAHVETFSSGGIGGE